ncbi:MAG: hypothetical protein KJO11_13935 [Gemmatimonadetes bacterium]|nr:hypothetical protein [Gemmatimonadota bacterium]
MRVAKRISSGLQAGLVAGGGVALFYLATDVVRLAPLETVAALARAFLGLPTEALPPGLDIAALATTGIAVGVYSLLHFAAFGALGLLATFVVPATSFWATLGRGGLFGGVAASLLFVGARTVTGSPFAVEPIGVPSLLLVNAAAGVLMAMVLAVHAADGSREL